MDGVTTVVELKHPLVQPWKDGVVCGADVDDVTPADSVVVGKVPAVVDCIEVEDLVVDVVIGDFDVRDTVADDMVVGDVTLVDGIVGVVAVVDVGLAVEDFEVEAVVGDTGAEVEVVVDGEVNDIVFDFCVEVLDAFVVVVEVPDVVNCGVVVLT